MKLICTVKECDIGLITYNSITSVSWGLGEGFFGHITPFKQQREWVCCFYLCTLNTAVYFTQKQKNVSKWLKVRQNAAGQVPYEKKLRLKEHTRQNKVMNKRISWWIQYLVNTRNRSKFEITSKCLLYFVTSIQNTNRERAA